MLKIITTNSSQDVDHISTLTTELARFIDIAGQYATIGAKFVGLKTDIAAINKAFELTTEENYTVDQLNEWIETCDYWVEEYAKRLEAAKTLLADIYKNFDSTVAGNLDVFNKVVVAYDKLIENEKTIQDILRLYGEGRFQWSQVINIIAYGRSMLLRLSLSTGKNGA